MRLARLELHGFKSFPDRTAFHFGPGISCVVGPNGSGKSNVVDALKWVVGEQSAKSLRGAEMTDVIFAGSADRKPVGFAEVVLVLTTDESRPFPGDYAALREVQVGRRLHRSGASEYSLNQTRVRRRDVIELLLDSGVGNDLYSFIEQGQVDKMISATPEERRSLVDEAAGISRYKARRNEAQERLEATAAQLDRAADVVDEMSRHLATLEAQVLKAATFRRLGTRIRLGELQLALAKHLALAADRSAVREDVDQKRAAEEKARADVLRREEDLEQRRKEIAIVEAGLGTLRDRVSELDGRIREANATAQLHERRAEEILAEKGRADEEGALQRDRSAAATAEAAAAEAERETLDADVEKTELALARATEDAAAAETAVKAARDGLAGAESRVQQAVRTRAAAESVLAESRRQQADRALRTAALGTELATGRADRLVAEQRKTAMVAARAEAEAALARADAAVTAADVELDRVRADEGEVRKRLAGVEEARDRRLADRERARAERSAALDRGRAWVDAAERQGAAARTAREARWSARIAAADKAGRAEIASARATAERESARMAAERDRAGVEEQDRLKAAVDAASAEAKAARAGRESADAAHLQAATALAQIDAEIAVVRRQLAAGGAGDEVVRARVPGAPPLLELAPEADRATWTRKLGDRAGWPVVRETAAVLAISGDRPAGSTVRMVAWLEGAPAPADAVHAGRDLESALGGPVPVVGEGFRIDPGGFVTLGPPDALEQAIAAERALADRRVTAESALADGTAAKAAAAERVAVADAAVSAASASRESAARAAGAAVAEARSAGAVAVAEAEAAARDRVERTLAELRAGRETDAAEADAASERWIAALRAELAAFPATAPPDDPAESGSELADARQAARTAGERTEAARRGRDGAAEGRRTAERARDGAAAAVSAVERELAELDRRIGNAEAELERLGAVHVDQADAAGLQGALDAASAAEEEARVAHADVRAAVSRAESAEREGRDAVLRIRVDRATLVERAAAARDRAAAARARVAEAVAAAERAEAHAVELGTHAEDARDARRNAVEDAAAAQVERGEAWDLLEVEKQRLGRLVDARESAERGLRQVRSAVERLVGEIERLTGQLSTVSSDLEVLRQRMEDRYQVSLSRLLERLRSDGRVVLEVDPEVRAGVALPGGTVQGVEPVEVVAADLDDEKGIRAAVASLEADKSALAALGEVNLAATQEYRELRVRHDELSAQRTDLELSVEGIRAAIAKLNRLCRERFRETFDQVDANFREVYPKLVGGGSARLFLTDEEDLLETGVEIFVQPPGKRLQNLQLLSGGEKAMTAIALLISLFRVKPSPFCVLDEVDAPLDEANGTRFNEMLKEMAAHSQFLVITHNRKTMEGADALYGITMARPGVSRLVSVDLEAW